MHLLALWPVRTEPSHVILADVFASLFTQIYGRRVGDYVATLHAFEAEAAVELRTDRSLMIILPVIVESFLRQ